MTAGKFTSTPISRLSAWLSSPAGLDFLQRFDTRDGPPSVLTRPLGSEEAAVVVRPRSAEPAVFTLSQREADRSAKEKRAPHLETLTPADDDKLCGCRLLEEGGLTLRDHESKLHSIAAGSARLIAYHPRRRAVYNLQLVDEHGECHDFYLKVLKRSAFDRAAESLQALPSTVGHVHFALPVGSSSKAQCYLTEACPGRSVHDLIKNEESVSPALLVDVCHGLASFAPATELTRRTFEHERGATLRQISRAAEANPKVDRLTELVRGLPEAEPFGEGLVHGDLHDKQCFVNGRDLFLIDLDDVHRGDPCFDAVNLSEHLLLRSLQYPRCAASLLQSSEHLLTTLRYDPSDARVGVIRALVRSRLAAVYALRPLQQDLAAKLLQRALNAFATLNIVSPS